MTLNRHEPKRGKSMGRKPIGYSQKKRQREIVSRLECMGADAEQARKLLSGFIDAQQGQKRQLERLRGGLKDKS